MFNALTTSHTVAEITSTLTVPASAQASLRSGDFALTERYVR